MNLIQTELNNAKKKMLETIPGTELVMLSPNNVAIVEAMIQNDSAYLKSSDKTAGPEGKYEGSTAYWMVRLKEALMDTSSASDDHYKEVLVGAITAVDRENSTHLNADGVGREEILNRLLSIEKNSFIDFLRDPDGTSLYLVDYISAPTHPVGVSPNGYKYKARTNVSFASKFCHYACFYLFEGEREQDNYSIYDNVLCKVLPKYIKHYKLKVRDLSTYGEYRKAVDDVIKTATEPISRNGLDHLLWYYFKGRI